MKKILLFLAFIFTFSTSRAQSIAAIRAAINTDITTQTVYHGATHVIVGSLMDSILHYVSIWDLQHVCGIGNTTNTHVIISNSSDRWFSTTNTSNGAFSIFRPNGIQMSDGASGSFYGFLSAPTLTATRNYLLPDEGAFGGGTDIALVLHKTKDRITIYSSTDTTKYSFSGIKGANVGSNGNFNLGYGAFNTTSTSGALGFFSGASHGGAVGINDYGNSYADSITSALATGGTAVAHKHVFRHIAGIVIDTIATLDDIPGNHPAGSPTMVAGAAMGTSPSGLTVSGDDRSGLISFTTGTSCPSTTGATIGTVTFNTAYTGAGVNIILTKFVDGSPDLTAVGNMLYMYFSATSSFSFTLAGLGIALTDAHLYSISYQVVQNL